VYLGGIRPDPVVAGFKRIIIKPEIENELSWVKSSYESMYGTIKSDWKKVKNSLEMNIVIPENTVAEVFVPASDVNSVKENGKSVCGNQDVKFLRIQDNCVVFQIGSGSYSLKSEMRLK
jgi:alpha-L-rhamnosidase